MKKYGRIGLALVLGLALILSACSLFGGGPALEPTPVVIEPQWVTNWTGIEIDTPSGSTHVALDVDQVGSGDTVSFKEDGVEVFDIPDGGVADFKNNAVTNLGAAGTDFSAAGGLSLAGPLTTGVDGAGTDVILYSDTTGDYFHWDQSAEQLIITGTNAATVLDIPDGNVVVNDDFTVTAGALDVTAGATTLEALSIGVAGTGADVQFFSDTSGDHLLWDSSDEALEITGTSAQNALEIVEGNLTVSLGGFDVTAGATTLEALNVGVAGTGADVYFYSDTDGDHLFWDESDEVLNIIGTNAQTALNVSDGNVVVNDDLTVAAGGFDVTAGATTLEALTIGVSGTGADVTFYSDTSDDLLLWDTSEECLDITGTNAQNALRVLDGNASFADDILVTGASDLRGNVSDGAGDFTIVDDVLITDTLTVNQAAAADIADFKDSGTTTVKIPDGGGLLLNPAGSPTGSEGLLSYDNAKTSFHALEVYDGNHWRPVDPRRDLRDHTFIVHSGTAEYDSVFSWIPLFTHPDLSVPMGGFWMAKYEMSQPTATRTDGDPIISDNSDPSTTPAVSVPGVALWDNIQFDEARKAVQNAGREYHLCTGEEWAAAAYWSQLAGTMPYGNNNNSSTTPGDVTIDAYDCVEGGMTDKLCGTGTGPNAFSLNYWGSGPMDLNGNVWEWVDGQYMDTSGYIYVFSNTIHIDTQVGTTTANSGTTITDTNQAWTAQQWVGYYLQTGTTAAITITSNGVTTITVASGTPSGDYSIVRRIDTDITASAGSSGQYILTLWNDEGDAAADAALPYLAIPRTSDGTGSATYGTDGFWYDKSAFRAALRGGAWDTSSRAGVFALYLNIAPSYVGTSFGFRACRAP